MSWLFSSLQPDDDPRDEAKQQQTPSSSGVQNDLSFLGQTLGRQLRGVASFLAPPPSTDDAVLSSNSPPQSPTQFQSQSQLQSPALLGIRNDLVEIGGSVKSGLSILSTNSNKAVTEISKLASNFLQLQNKALEDAAAADEDGEDDDEGSTPGITDEVLAFVTEISVLPDYWTEFPIPLDHDFSMSDAQREHAYTVDELVPGFADLRVRVCSSMSEGQFWLIYFLLLLPRLNEHDFELLSSPKIVEARGMLLHKLQNKRNTQLDEDTSEKSMLDSPNRDIQVGKAQGQQISSREKEALTDIVNTAGRLKIEDEESTDHWSEEASISSGTFVDSQTKHEPEEDMSFSDLEDDENDLSSRRSSDLRQGRDFRACSPSGSDWIQLNRSAGIEGSSKRASQSKEKDSEGEDSNDWLTVDGFD